MPTIFCRIQIRLQRDLYTNLLVIIAGNLSVSCLFVSPTRKQQYSAIYRTNPHPLRSFQCSVDFLRVVIAILLLLASLQQAKKSVVESLIRGRNTALMV